MKKIFIAFFVVAAAVLLLQRASARKATTGTYMQIFYEGPGWLAGRRVLSYSPAFRGKTEEVVQEPDSVRRMAPNAFLEGVTEKAYITSSGYATVSTEKGTFIPDSNGKMHLETAADRQLERRRATAERNRAFRLTETRSDLAKNTLTKALNDAAADGWEVVQLAPTGAQGGLVYLLKHP